MRIWGSLQLVYWVSILLMKKNLAKIKVNFLKKKTKKSYKCLAFFYTMTDFSKNWLKFLYSTWTAFRGYKEEDLYIFDSYRKIKKHRDFTISFGFRSYGESLNFIRLLEAEEEEPQFFRILNISKNDLKWHTGNIKFLFLRLKQVSFSRALLILENDQSFTKNQLKILQIVKINLFFKIKKILQILLLCTVFSKIRLMFFILKYRLLLLGGRMDLNVRKSTSDLNCLP